ncbi:MAG: hypothetical protein H6745_30960 [Deltaproteobacteria bacterium]|nr:hypothetical protein [Deltaproteobacteria bacterium]
MHRSELDDSVTCIECGAEIFGGDDLAYAVAPGLALCWSCSVRRGGVFDIGHARWRDEPTLVGLDLDVRDL